MGDLKARPSKLSTHVPETRKSGLASQDRKEPAPRTFRLGVAGIANLKKITAAVNEISQTKIKEADIVRALLSHGAHSMKPEQVLKAYKDSL